MSEGKPADGGAVERILGGWRYFGHPIRPGAAEIAAVERRLAEIERPRTLALGATPELVDLAIGRNARRVVLIDWNEDAAEAMRRLASRDWSGVERIVSDWREPRKELEGGFDAAIGDGTFTFMRFPEDWRLLFGILARYIVPGGLIATRELFLPPEPFDFPSRVDAALERYEAEAPEAEPERRFILFRNMLAELRMGSVLAATDGGGRVDSAARAAWHERLGKDLAHRYPDGDPAMAVDAVFGERSKARPMEAISTITTGEAEKLIGELGFRMESNDPIGSAPAPGALRLMVARRV
ncbi:MAG: class I SAM-dependent methyltransferase [Candidatus Eisenbacteria bacterium]|nr:class I SAM-dependent methyltransferase [Candidatus Eisenbacteria bacterium]